MYESDDMILTKANSALRCHNNWNRSSPESEDANVDIDTTNENANRSTRWAFVNICHTNKSRLNLYDYKQYERSSYDKLLNWSPHHLFLSIDFS